MDEISRNTMKQLPEELRPYERFEKLGPEAISDSELLAILIKSGTKKKRASEVADEVLDAAGGLSGLGRMSLRALSEIKGIGRVKAITIMAASQIGIRIDRAERLTGPSANSAGAIASLYMKEMNRELQEVFRVVLLDTKLKIIRTVTVSRGTVDRTLVHPREVFSEAIMCRASGIIAMHNHPSGDETPSTEDYAVTERLYEAGKILGIDLTDHIIFGNGRYYSFAEHGEIGTGRMGA